MTSFTVKDLHEALKSVGISKNDIVLIHSDLRAFGMPEDVLQSDQLLPYYCNAFLDAVDTLVAPAYYYEYARHNFPFDVDFSPVSMELGSLSRFIAMRPNRVRSCNPLQSLAAIGRQAEMICGGNSLAGYGTSSPWHRIHQHKGKILFFGTTLQPMTYIHHIEQQFGVPHLYLKTFDIPVFRNGKTLGFPVSAVRYLEFDIQYDLSGFQTLLTEKGVLRSARLGRGEIYSASFDEVFEAAIECLNKDPYAFLKIASTIHSGQNPF